MNVHKNKGGVIIWDIYMYEKRKENKE